ncbi:MAG TPA: carboxypeptidase regulatory-like domain-containing protein [Polyangiales bacterium]|nr:carboxypeptidase regulatory-like domain-containing protein [Polyangiales bacterium]
MKYNWRNAIVFASLSLAEWSLAACGGADTVDTRTTPPHGTAAVGGARSGTAGLGAGNGFAGTFSSLPQGGALGVGNMPNAVPLGCTGLQCQQHSCPSGMTTISGRIYDPAGKNPLYNVAAYIPNSTPMPLQTGASCDPCEKLYSGNPVVTALSDATGNFKIQMAPDGPNIPLVIQIGKWRRQFVLPNVVACQDNPVPDKLLTLPKNRMEGDIPNIAISTGGADTLECLLRRIGVDASEYAGGPTGGGRIHIFQGSGRGGGGGGGRRGAPNTDPPGPASATGLWNSTAELMKYDITLLSCEGEETQNMNQQALHDYASMGGRVFASHFHYSWFNSGPYGNENLATWLPGSNDLGDINGTIVTSFPKGEALSQWLMNTNALMGGVLPIEEARHNADVGAMNVASQPWILADPNSEAPGATQYFSFNTPTDTMIGPDGKDYCGRVVYSDLHVGAASNDQPDMPVPGSCSNVDLSPQEKALEFMLFDLSACVIPDDRIPEPPIVI